MSRSRRACTILRQFMAYVGKAGQPINNNKSSLTSFVYLADDKTNAMHCNDTVSLFIWDFASFVNINNFPLNTEVSILNCV
jgi:hypothetical protein